jgi:hypothetical protein
MSTAIQQIIKSIFSDHVKREQYLANPEGFLSLYSLTDLEKKAILNTDIQFVTSASQSNRVEAAIDPLIDWM